MISSIKLFETVRNQNNSTKSVSSEKDDTFNFWFDKKTSEYKKYRLSHLQQVNVKKIELKNLVFFTPASVQQRTGVIFSKL